MAELPPVDCKHVQQIVRVPEAVKRWEDLASPTAACSECQSTLSPWICLTCGTVHCGRYIAGHAFRHFKETGHSVSMDAAAGSVHCYLCDDYLPEDTLTDLIRSMRSALEAVLARNSKREADDHEAENAKKARPNTDGKRKINLKQTLGAVGLRNLGNTCYMNSVLQALSNTAEFRDFFLNSYKPVTNSAFTDDTTTRSRAAAASGGSGSSGPRLADEVYRVLREIWQPQATAVAPQMFLSALWRLIPTFRGYQQQDAQELLLFALERMHAELSNVDAGLNGTKPSQKAASEERTSVVTDVFGGALWNEVTCLVCKTVSTKEDPFLDLSLDVKDPSNGGSGKTTIEDCLRFFTRVEELEDSERYLCAKCGVRQPSTKKFSIRVNPKRTFVPLASLSTAVGMLALRPAVVPCLGRPVGHQVLCLHLKRFRWGTYTRSKIKDPVGFPLQGLDLTAFMDGKAPSPRLPPLYDLYAVVMHHGAGLGSGHYTALVRNEEHGQWLDYNDSTVQPVLDEDVQAAQAYLLFYRWRGVVVVGGGGPDRP